MKHGMADEVRGELHILFRRLYTIHIKAGGEGMRMKTQPQIGGKEEGRALVYGRFGNIYVS